MESLIIRVPASTSNLGPGFDCLGLALSLYLDVHFAPQEGATHKFEELGGTSADWPQDHSNLLTLAFDRGLEELGHTEPVGGSWRVNSEIPMCRGLGSSGAAIAAGLVLAMRVSSDATPSKEVYNRLVSLAATLEGHPDNTTASLLGGCTLALPEQDKLEVIRPPVHASIGIAVAWPDSPLETHRARTALPDTVPHRDAVENARRLPFLLEGLRTGRPELLRLGGQDRLHVAARLPLIRGGAAALDAAHRTGAYLATISGSGSTLIALGPPQRMDDIRGAMHHELDRADGPASSRVVEIVERPPTAEPPTPAG